MDKPGIINLCKEIGCCDACCLRFIGLKNPKIYESPGNFVLQFQSAKNTDDSQKTIEELKSEDQISQDETNKNQNGIADVANYEAKDVDCADLKDSQPDVLKDNSIALNKISTEDSSNKIVEENSKDSESPPAKRCKLNVCASCLGVLQEDLWAESFTTVKEVLDKKGYECTTFACGLSSPIAIILREKAIVLRIVDKFPGFDGNNVTPLKEAWKWSFATRMAANINKVLDSGAVSPLLITLNYDYPDDLQELEILKTISPKLFQTRSQQRRRYTTEFTRRSVEQALENVTLPSMVEAGGGLPLASTTAKCVSVVCTHSPIYLAGRYLKLSRNLPQTPWVLEGRRVLPSSVQEIIFKPIADIYKLTQEEAEQRLKFVAAGREDVDVRCLGEGRPFAIEITDPRRQLTPEELARACEEIEKSGEVVVKSMVPIEREDLTELKKGEETKSKTYEAICIKLTHSKYDDVSPDAPIRVTKEDLQRINEFRNTPEGDPIKIKITQKTPIRVLHRRPLLTRTRGILELNAYEVPEHQHLFRIVVTTAAGTYVKEWACGELGRTAPALAAPLAARAALLALDVAAVTLRWPPALPST